MKERTEIIFFWNNPPDGTGMIQKITGGRGYERMVSRRSYLTPVESSKVLNLSVTHILRLIERGRLKAIKKGNTVLIRMGDLVKYRETKRPPGRPRKEAFLS